MARGDKCVTNKKRFLARGMLHLDDGKNENGWRTPQMWQGVTDVHLLFSIVSSFGIMKNKCQLTAIT